MIILGRYLVGRDLLFFFLRVDLKKKKTSFLESAQVCIFSCKEMPLSYETKQLVEDYLSNNHHGPIDPHIVRTVSKNPSHFPGVAFARKSSPPLPPPHLRSAKNATQCLLGYQNH